MSVRVFPRAYYVTQIALHRNADGTYGRIVGRASVRMLYERPEMASPVNKSCYTAPSFSLARRSTRSDSMKRLKSHSCAHANLSVLTKAQTVRLGGSRNSRQSTLARLTSFKSRKAKRKFVIKHAGGDLKFDLKHLSQTTRRRVFRRHKVDNRVKNMRQ